MTEGTPFVVPVGEHYPMEKTKYSAWQEPGTEKNLIPLRDIPDVSGYTDRML